MLNAVIYARFSSDMQREESIDAQVRACKAYAKSKGYTVVKEYVDEAKSGRSTLTRDAYNQMMADAMETTLLFFIKSTAIHVMSLTTLYSRTN